MKKRILALVGILALVVALVVPATLVYAETGSVTISGGSLASTTAAISLAATQLTGADITATDTTNAWTATDPTGSGAGWHLTVASTNFTSDDVQMVYNNASSGNFTLTYSGVTTAAIQFNANAAAVKSALELLTSKITTVTVTGSGTSASPWVIRFIVDTGSGIMTATDTYLVSGTSTITLATINISVADQQFGITLVNADVGVTEGNTQPVQTSGSLQNIGTSTVSFLTAPTDTGMGSYTLDPDFTLEVRAETYAAAYTATVTVAIVSGP